MVYLRRARDQRKKEPRTRGQSLVEFAVILPVFLMIAFGIIDFGLAFDASIGISNASREGARQGTTAPSAATITARVRTAAGRLNDSRLTVSVSCQTSSGAACAGGLSGAVTGTSIVVTVGYNYPMLTPIAFGTVIPLTSTTMMRVE